MSANEISKEIAALEMKVTSTNNKVIAKTLNSKISKLKEELKSVAQPTEAKMKLAKAKAKIRSMSKENFDAFVQKLSNKNGYAFLKELTSDQIKRDIQRVAKPVGWRYRGRENMKKPLVRDIRSGNNVYFENRSNRADVSRAVRLKEGGSVYEFDKNEIEKSAIYYTDESSWTTKPTISKFQDEIDSDKELLRKLENKEITPSKIIGGGYKSSAVAKKVALEYLKKRIAVRQRAIEILKERGDNYAKGGFVGKGEMVWKKLSASKKAEFLYENFTPQITPRSQETLVGKAYNFLPKNVKIVLESKYANVEDYAKGGGVGGDELMGGQPNSSKPSGYTLVQAKGREIIVTDDGGKTQERWVKSNGYSGYTLHYKGNQYEFTDSLAKGGFIGKQANLDRNKNGKIDSEDLRMIRENKMANGGKVYFKEGRDADRTGRPQGDIEKEILEKVKYFTENEELFVGNFGWRTPKPYDKLADGYLYKLEEYDLNLIKDIKLKSGEKVFRYLNRTTAISGSVPFIKINLDKGLLYWTIDNEYDEIRFDTKGYPALWVNILSEKMAKGGFTTTSLKEGDFVWNAVGKKLIVREVNNDEYLLEGFGSIAPFPFSKSKVDGYIKSGEWTLKPQMAKGGELHRGQMN